MWNSVVDAVICQMGALPMSSWSGTGTDPRKRLYYIGFAVLPVPLTDSEKPRAWLERVGVISDYDTGFKKQYYSLARIARGKLLGEMEQIQ